MKPSGHQRPSFTPNKLTQAGRTNVTLYSSSLSPLRGRSPALPHLNMQNRETGVTDHILPLSDLLALVLRTNRGDVNFVLTVFMAV